MVSLSCGFSGVDDVIKYLIYILKTKISLEQDEKFFILKVLLNKIEIEINDTYCPFNRNLSKFSSSRKLSTIVAKMINSKARECAFVQTILSAIVV